MNLVVDLVHSTSLLLYLFSHLEDLLVCLWGGVFVAPTFCIFFFFVIYGRTLASTEASELLKKKKNNLVKL